MTAVGWVKLWRQTLDSEVFANAGLWHLFTRCILSAAHKARHVPVRTGRGLTQIPIGPGQFVYGGKTWSREMNLPLTTLYRRMKRLESLNCIAIKPDTHFSIVTIVNWATYQRRSGNGEHPTGYATGYPTNRQRISNEQATDTNKNGKNGENAKNEENGEKFTDGRARADVFLSWNAETASKTFELAQAINASLGPKLINRANRFNDRRVILSAALAVANGILPDGSLWGAVERAKLKRPRNPAAALTAALKKAATQVNQDFGAILKAADEAIPPRDMAGTSNERQADDK